MASWADLPATIRILYSALTRLCGKLFRSAAIALGTLAFISLVLAFTRIPFDVHRWLGTAAGECADPADVIAVLGGSGMPSGPELLRLHRAARLADDWPGARLVVIHPGEPAALRAMADELVMRGVEGGRITTLNQGDNTREQAMVMRRNVSGQPAVALVTAPENMYRSVKAFRHAGLNRTCGMPAWDHAMFHDFDYEHAALGGRGWMPDVSDQPALRYTFWNYLKLEVTCLRECAAIAYYRLNGWI